MFENKDLRRLFWPNMNEVTREWKSLHDEELNDLCSSHKILRLTKRDGFDGRDMKLVWGREIYIKDLAGKPE